MNGRSSHAGFTLIELMIAMILGLIVIAGVASVFLAGQQSFRTNNALADVQDSSRIAFELMARDIREADLTGCSNQRAPVNVLNNKGTAWWANWANAVHGFDAGAVDPAVTTGTGLNERVANTSSLELISAANTSYSVTTAETASPGSFTLNESGADLQGGDIVLLCDPGQSSILQINTFTPGTKTFTYVGGGTKPGNSSPIALDYTGPDQPTARPYPANSHVAQYNAVDWYIGNNPIGGKSLYRVSLQNVVGVPTPTAEEMVRDVTGLALTYLNPVTGSGFVPAAAITDWSGVTAVRATFVIQSTFRRATTQATPVSRQYSFTTTLRNRVN